MKLVIVESPAKCATIKRYLGQDYMVEASIGHICDLATTGKGGLGVDINNGFAPNYVISSKKRNVVNELIRKASHAEEVILATDPDREGEAIAWHLARVLKLDMETTKRLEFHEITRQSITDALKNPRTIDLNLVSSQEARRIIDRIIGFTLSGLVSRKIKSKSAGRVQSATLKMICDHEEEIEKFISEEYWVLNTKTRIGHQEYDLALEAFNGEKIKLHNEEEARKILDSLGEDLKIKKIVRKVVSKESKEPFTTSTLQQEAFAKLHFGTEKTQSIAQKLYEGITVGDEHMGLITYIRTDSTRLSPTYTERAANFIKETYGSDYLGHPKKLKSISNMQDAHEAIRPTSNHHTPEYVKQYLKEGDEYKLYKLIYNRALASLMKPKVEEVMEITLDNNGVEFFLELTRTVFKGYEILEEKKEKNAAFPEISEGDTLKLIYKEIEQKFTQPPAHYSEAKIVKLMEEVGIGRPSTYATTIKTLKQRGYTVNQSGTISITDQGKKTVYVLENYFEDVVNVKYTAKMETQLDNVSQGIETKEQVLERFYEPFIKDVNEANEKIKKEGGITTGQKCPVCGANLVYKEGKHGQFVGCSNYPKCKYVQKDEKEEAKHIGRMCPKCHKHELVERKLKNGRTFIACSDYPRCDYVENIEDEEPNKVYKICPDCGGNLVKKRGPHGYFLGCTNYPKCHHMEKLTRKSHAKKK